MTDSRALRTVGAFLGGFAVIVVCGKVIFPQVGGATVVPDGMYLQGLIVGSLSALLAIGLILIYRTNRIINFAQGALGAVAATLSNELAILYDVPYFVALMTGIVASVALSLFSEWAIIRRFAKAPRLILTVATIGVAQLLSVLELVPTALNRNASQRQQTGRFQSPFTGRFEFGQVQFTADHIIVLVAVPLILIGLAYFFSRTRYGVASRAAAENEERARLLGCRVKRVSLIVWGLAGLLSAVTAILRAPILGFQLGALQGSDLLLRALAAAVLARMESLPAAVAAAVLITMGEQTIFFGFGATGLTDAFLLGVVVVGLLFQRKRFGRIDPGSSSWRAVQEVRPVPRELVRLTEVVRARWGGRGLLVAVVAVLPFVLSSAHTNLASVVIIYAMVGISLVVLTGWSGNISLGQWAIVGVGALVSQKLASSPSPPDFFFILIIAGVIGAAVSLLIGLPALRIRGLFLGVTTLAFAIAATNWIFQWRILTADQPVVRPFIFGLIDTTGERAWYFVCFAGLVVTLYMARNLRRSRWGRNLIAMRDNETQAQSLGMRLTASRLGAFAISGFIAALAGALYAYNAGSIDYIRFRDITSLVMFSLVVIGGMGSLAGPVLGAIYVLGIQYFLPATLQLFATGFGLLLLLLVFPGGLGQIFYSLRDRYLRWVAERRDITVPSLFADKLQAEPVVELAEAKVLGVGEEAKARKKAKAKVLAETRSRG